MFKHKKINLKIGEMSCQHCVQQVTDALTELEGVRQVKVNLKRGTATVKYDPESAQIQEMEKAVNQAGFQFGGQV
ncbi:MAG: copper ion binding protein [Candidatus Poribacteria bacterium]|nr:copper ion binding protein [Candidatus Poribacteria bacterium]